MKSLNLLLFALTLSGTVLASDPIDIGTGDAKHPTCKEWCITLKGERCCAFAKYARDEDCYRNGNLKAPGCKLEPLPPERPAKKEPPSGVTPAAGAR